MGDGRWPGTRKSPGMESDDLSSSPGLATDELCKPRQMAELLWASGLLFTIISTSKSKHENAQLYTVPAILSLLLPDPHSTVSSLLCALEFDLNGLHLWGLLWS